MCEHEGLAALKEEMALADAVAFGEVGAGDGSSSCGEAVDVGEVDTAGVGAVEDACDDLLHDASVACGSGAGVGSGVDNDAPLCEGEATEGAGRDVGSAPSRKLSSVPGGRDGFEEMERGAAPDDDVVHGSADVEGAHCAELQGGLGAGSN